MKIRITFSKTGSLRYTGHLDLHRIWERTCRRAAIPLRYSQGFHPQPKISLGSALPLGIIGKAELVDIQLEEDRDPKEIMQKLKESAPPGLDISSIEILDPQQPPLQTMVEFADYTVEFLDPVDTKIIESGLAAIDKMKSIQRERKGKSYDLRPLIQSMSLVRSSGDKSPYISMRLSASPGATGRPEEVLSEMGINPEHTRITRTGLVLSEAKQSPVL